jgi:hypothetical protein
MAQIQSPETYVDGQQVTAARLNNQTNGAVLLPGAVTDQTALAAGTVATGDTVIIHDASTSALRKTTAGDLLASGLPITTGAITGSTGADLVITPAAGQKVDVAGDIEAEDATLTGGLTVTGNTTLDASLDVNGLASFNVTSAVKIPVGTTGQRPGTPVAGQMRYNSTLDQAEVYSGTEWKAVGGSPFDASGGVITTIDGYKIHTYTVSGTFTPSLTKEGKVEVLVVGAGGGGSNYHPHGGGGGGGAVVTGFINIAKGTAPMSVVVGTGGAPGSAGGTSYFGPFTANGGGSGSGYYGGGSGSGNSGTAGGSPGGGGGGGAKTIGLGVARGGHFGGEGFGSSISGTLKLYGGGGGGGGSLAAENSNAPGAGLSGGAYGAWGSANASIAIANSGGGGGGSTLQSDPDRYASSGADGIVIIRYRVS